MTPDDLLAGPRGRRMLLEYLLARPEPSGSVERDQLREAAFQADSLYPPETVDAEGIIRAIRAADPPEANEHALIQAVFQSVDAAMYWQPPDGLDRICALPAAREALRKTAGHLVATAFTEWWGSGFDPDSQVWLRFLERPVLGASVQSGRPRHKLAPSARKLADWREAMDATEETDRLQRDPDVEAPFSGEWWSAPVFLADATCRRLPEAGAAGLWWVEDAFGPECAELFRVKVDREVRILENRSADDWAELCQKYPVEVTWSRRHDWYQVTGRDGRWVMPDWSRVAEDYDGVHLTVLGYLNAAGRAIEVSGGLAAVLSGWNPDETYWLNDHARVIDDREQWEGDVAWRQLSWRRTA